MTNKELEKLVKELLHKIELLEAQINVLKSSQTVIIYKDSTPSPVTYPYIPINPAPIDPWSPQITWGLTAIN